MLRCERVSDLCAFARPTVAAQQTRRIQNISHLRSDMDKGCEQRPEKSKSRKTHAERIDGNGTDEVLPNGAANPPSGLSSLDR